jgi:hypothetical protein
MDLNDPRFLTHVRRTRPDLVCLPMNWLEEGIDPRPYWASQLRGWNGIFVGANRYGTEDDVTFCGRSSILQAGVVVAEAPPEGDGWWGWAPVAEAAATPPEGAPAS